MENILKKTLIVLLLVAIALFSILFVADKATAYETHSDTSISIDEKVSTVLRLTATSTLASAGITAIPGDMATPIGEKLADFTEYFLLILCVLYAEKYLMAVLGAATFKFLIPAACAATAVSLFYNPEKLRQLAMKLAAFGLVIYFAIPLSIRVSDMIYNNYETSVNDAIAMADEFNSETAGLSDAEGSESIVDQILSKISQTADGLARKASDILNNYVESLAVMIVTSCVMPLLVLLLIIWVIKLLTGIDLSPVNHRRGRHGGPGPHQNPAE